MSLVRPEGGTSTRFRQSGRYSNLICKETAIATAALKREQFIRVDIIPADLAQAGKQITTDVLTKTYKKS